jgi:hypothetical protein
MFHRRVAGMEAILIPEPKTLNDIYAMFQAMITGLNV